ncbi:DUF2092 domain-containing protein [Shivajiella indica]|uniref:DUF2092 domain-containing protein n=1 Tax=Shivajiella indica TaxID=872115 RepID=A0ABW5B636_9BACT
MRKFLILGLLSFLVAISLYAQESSHFDNRAVVLLDRMSEVIGELNSCSFKLNASSDKVLPEVGLVKEFFKHQIQFVGPDKMHIQTNAPTNNHFYWYNGDIMMYYSLTYNHYGFIETPDNIIETIDMVNAEYGVDFPAADFFYPTFTDDLIDHSDTIHYLGLVNVDGVDCHHIIAVGPEQHLQLWLRNDTFTLPHRFVILEKSENYTLQYEGIFSEWMINPYLPESIFDFVVPESAKRLTIVPKSKAN